MITERLKTYTLDFFAGHIPALSKSLTHFSPEYRNTARIAFSCRNVIWQGAPEWLRLAPNSWFQLKVWSQDRGIQPQVRLCIGLCAGAWGGGVRSAWDSVFLCSSPCLCMFSLSNLVKMLIWQECFIKIFFSSLILVCLVWISLNICWDSLTFLKLLSVYLSPKLGCFLLLFLQMFSAFFSFRDSGKMNRDLVILSQWLCSFIFFYRFPLYSSDWIISVALASSWLTLFFIISILQLSTSKEFRVLLWLLHFESQTFILFHTHIYTIIFSLCWDSSFFFSRIFFLTSWSMDILSEYYGYFSGGNGF